MGPDRYGYKRRYAAKVSQMNNHMRKESHQEKKSTKVLGPDATRIKSCNPTSNERVFRIERFRRARDGRSYDLTPQTRRE